MSTEPHRGDVARAAGRDHASAAREAGRHPALITDYDSPPTLTLILPPGLGKDQALAGLAQAIRQVRAKLARRARRFQQGVEEHAARGDQLRQALCRGQVIASGEAAAYIDEALVAAFDLWDQYDAQLAAQTAGATDEQAAATAAGMPSPLQATDDDIGSYIEAADEATLRRALRAVASQLDGLRQVARASQTLAESAKSAVHDQHAAAPQVDDAGRADADELTASAEKAFATSEGFDFGAFHIDLCVNAVAAAVAAGLGLTEPRIDRAAREDPPPGGGRG